MTAEFSKKLQTTLTGQRCLGNMTSTAVFHDLYIAHEQRELISRLVDDLRILGYHDLDCVKAAAPFLED